MLKRCPVCNTEFESNNLSQKYCSEECRLIRVRENDRIRKRKERAEKRAICEEEKQRIKQAKAEAQEKEDARQSKERQAELRKKAAAGDPFARMNLAEPNSKEYWEAYKEIFLRDEYSKDYTMLINGIDLKTENAAREIVRSIEVQRRISSQLKKIT